MGSLADYLEKKLSDHWLGGVAYTAPGTVYIGLYTADPTDAGGGTEVTGGSYARVGVTNNATNWPNASGITAAKANANAITFPQATADWGTVTSFGIFDASTAGNLLAWSALGSSKVIQNGDTASFAAGALTSTLD